MNDKPHLSLRLRSYLNFFRNLTPNQLSCLRSLLILSSKDTIGNRQPAQQIQIDVPKMTQGHVLYIRRGLVRGNGSLVQAP